MEKIAIIGTGYMARIIASRAKELNIESHCFSIDDNSVAAEVADYFHHVNILDVDALTDACKEIGIDGVVATTELTILPANQVAFSLGLNGNDVTVAKEITDKSIIREKVKNVTGLSQPWYEFCDNTSEPNVKEFPVIVKPVAAGGKRGISVVNDANELKTALSQAIGVSKVKGALIEEFIQGGQEYSVETLSYHNRHYVIQITQKDSSGPPHCVELGHHQPAPLSNKMRENVENTIKGILTAAGVANGPCHIEIKIVQDKIFLIEINGRLGGDHIAYPLTELSTGFKYISGIIMVALDKFDEKELLNLEKNYCGVYFVTTQTSYLKSIFDNCDSQPWLYKKNEVSSDLQPITHNDGFNINYFIYFSKQQKPKIL